MRRRVRGVFVVVGLLVLVTAPSAGGSVNRFSGKVVGVPVPALLAAPIVLGGEVYGGEYGEGWGAVRPHTIYNGGVPSGLIQNVHWSSWGGAEARGRGRHPIYKPRGGYYRHPVVARLKATRIGTCEGRDAYLKLLIREPRRPGGPLGPWHSWSGPQTICEPYGSYLTR